MLGIPSPDFQFFTLGRGRSVHLGDVALDVCRWPTDPIGTFFLTLTNVVIGSRVHVERQGDGMAVYDAVAAASDVTITLNAYAPGNVNNALRIKIRKGTGSPTYRPFETLVTAVVGAQSIYIGQIADE